MGSKTTVLFGWGATLNVEQFSTESEALARVEEIKAWRLQHVGTPVSRLEVRAERGDWVDAVEFCFGEDGWFTYERSFRVECTCG